MTQADTVILNARCLTMVPGAPRAEAMALAGNRILAVGSRSDIEALATPATKRIDAQGNTVMPGLVEAHLHLFIGAYGLRLLQLDGIKGHAALHEAVTRYARDNPDEGLLICKAADYTLFGDGIATTRQLLDQVLPDRPLILIVGDHHTGWANTIALERAGLLHGRAMPVGSEIVLDDQGLATGELQENEAIDAVMVLRTSGGRENLGLLGVEPPDGLDAAARAADADVLREGLRYCASFGFTSLHNMDGNRYQLDLLRGIEQSGDLCCRIEVPFHLTPKHDLGALELASEWTRTFDTGFLRCGRVKMFMDGVIDSGTAVMVDDYADQPGWRGEPLHDAARFAAICTEADARGLQISVHAIGDGAVRRVLDGYEAARTANGARDARHRIEHIEILHPRDVPRVADLNVVASMQPPHPPGAMDFPLEPWITRVGDARLPMAYPVQTLRDMGVPIAFASDWPVSDIDPMRGVKAAITRKPWRPGDPAHDCTLMQALHGYCAGGAYAGHDDHHLGQLAPGYLADVVVMDRDLEAEPIDTLDQARAALTFCGGQLTWEA